MININKETKSYLDTNINISPTEANQNQIHSQFVYNDMEQDQISILKDLSNLKDINNKTNNTQYTNNNTNTNNTNNNLFTTSNISNNYNIKYNNNFYKTINHNNNILYPQNVLSFTTKKNEKEILNTNPKVINKLSNSKKFDYYNSI